MIQVSDNWKQTYPGAFVGILAMDGVRNHEQHREFEAHKQSVIDQLRTRFAGYDRGRFKALPVIEAYNDYYKRFKKSYHVQLQLESVVLKGKSIPSANSLVEAMFAAELKNQLLTAGHDLSVVHLPVRVDTAQGVERFIRINGQEQAMKQDDMYIADQQGIISSVIYGPDQRTKITSETTRVLFTTYAPPGIGEDDVTGHMEDIRDNVLIFSPTARIEMLEVLKASAGSAHA